MAPPLALPDWLRVQRTESRGRNPRSPGGERTPGGPADPRGAREGALAQPPTRLQRCRRTVPEAPPPRAVMWNPLHETDSASVAWRRPRRLCAGAVVLGAGLFVLGFLFGTRGRTGVRAMLGPRPAGCPAARGAPGPPAAGDTAAGLRGGDRAGGRADQLPRVRWDLVAGDGARLRSGRAAVGQAPRVRRVQKP